jgi:hypothetical protein
MKMFIINTKNSSEAISVLEVEGEMVSSLEDPSVMWPTNEGEFKFRILKPESLGKVIYCSHSVYSTWVDATAVAKAMIRQAFEFNKRKYKIEFSEEDVLNKCDKIELVML